MSWYGRLRVLFLSTLFSCEEFNDMQRVVKPAMSLLNRAWPVLCLPNKRLPSIGHTHPPHTLCAWCLLLGAPWAVSVGLESTLLCIVCVILAWHLEQEHSRCFVYKDVPGQESAEHRYSTKAYLPMCTMVKLCDGIGRLALWSVVSLVRLVSQLHKWLIS
jgi:hypothetical protein